MFKATRVFCERNDATQMAEWFFQAREGIIGPYESQKVAETALAQFIDRCRDRGCDGGRDGRTEGGLSLEPMESSSSPFVFDPLRRKRGIDSLN